MGTDFTSDFFESHRQGVISSAQFIVPLVLELVRPRSVVDIGCGTGTWLSAFIQHGVTDVLGIDGEYVDRHALELPEEQFRAEDLSRPFTVERKFDLVVCLEVAEHLPPESAASLIHSLCDLAPVALFAAAIPFQGGVNHLNEQWPEYWAEYFDDEGFLALDPFRAKIWQNDGVEFWYAQNLLMFARQDYLKRSASLENESKETTRSPMSLVHPKLFMGVAKKGAKALVDYEFYSAESEKYEAAASKLKASCRDYKTRADGYRIDAERYREDARNYAAEVALVKKETEIYRADAERYRDDARNYAAEVALVKNEIEIYRADAERNRDEAKRYAAELTLVRSELSKCREAADIRNMPLGRVLKALPVVIAGSLKRRKVAASKGDC